MCGLAARTDVAPRATIARAAMDENRVRRNMVARPLCGTVVAMSAGSGWSISHLVDARERRVGGGDHSRQSLRRRGCGAAPTENPEAKSPRFTLVWPSSYFRLEHLSTHWTYQFVSIAALLTDLGAAGSEVAPARRAVALLFQPTPRAAPT